MNITPSDYGEPWQIINDGTYTGIYLRDKTPFRGNPHLSIAAQPRTIAAVNALAGVPDNLLDKLAVQDRNDPFRMLLMCLIAEPTDQALIAALRDELDQRWGEPEVVTIEIRGEVVRYRAFKSNDWWRDAGMSDELVCGLGRWVGSNLGFAPADFLSHTAAFFAQKPGFGPRRKKALLKFLKANNLSLKEG